ncbi:RING-3 [Thelonectria olida]|uniref:RING-3 n=1 Tax=Thelonectria olida TaxID=1576542 RepID=A0A9P8VMZ3_9HYPO|nr:RING-3 [Thelonectria olida]
MLPQADSRTPRKPSKVRQACDACHTRKVRCDGCKPCINCRASSVECSYFAVHKKTGPKGGPRHGRRISQPQFPCSRTGDRGPRNPQTREMPEAAYAGDGEMGRAFQPSPRISAGCIRWCLDAYFLHKYPLTPILDRHEIDLWLQRPLNSPSQYGLLTSCCAVISLSPEIHTLQPEVEMLPARFLIAETLRSRQHCNIVENQSLIHVQTSFFLYASFFCLDKDNAAWYYLREAITILQTLRLHEESTYSDAEDQVSAIYARRMFWVLFITERAYALQRHRPITLQNTLNLPTIEPLSPDAEILLGFLDLISLFRHFDSDFITTWNSATPSSGTDPTHLSRLQRLLKHTLSNVSGYCPVQQADLLISREWLKVIVWKLCVSKTVLSTTDSEDVMSLRYPASVARDVVLVSRQVPTEAFEANGIGILEKVFDVACSLADLLSLVPMGSQASTMDVGPVDALMEMVGIVGTTFGGSYKHLDMLADKANRCLLRSIDRGLPLLEVPDVLEEEVVKNTDLPTLDLLV